MISSQDISSSRTVLCSREGEMLVPAEGSPANGSNESYSVERDQPLYSVTLLHQRSLVHGPNPAIHVLLCVRTEEICPHPAVFCLWANHRVLIVNVGAHSCMARLSKRKRRRERERTDVRTSHWRQEKAAMSEKTLLSCSLRLTAVDSVRTKFAATLYWKQRKRREQSAAAETMWTLCCFWQEKHSTTQVTFSSCFLKKLQQKYTISLAHRY